MTGFGLEILPLRFFAMTPGASGGMTASGATGTGGIGRRGFFVGMTAGFFGMEHIMRLPMLEIKCAALVNFASMPVGQYRTRHPLQAVTLFAPIGKNCRSASE
jgi:hypothetical protein